MSLSDLLESNPVLAIESELAAIDADLVRWSASARILDKLVQSLHDSGVGLPAARLHQWAHAGWLSPRLALTGMRAPPARVVGLVVDPISDLGFVVPLCVDEADDWWIASVLPLDPQRLSDLLVRIVDHAASGSGGALPERVSARIATSFPRPVTGRSMDVAGVLALLLATAPGCAPDGAVCATIELVGDGVVAVEHVDRKLAAFEREVGLGGLLVRHCDCPSGGRWDDLFSEVWCVGSVDELADRLLRAEWLDAMLAVSPLDGNETHRIEARVDALLRAHDHRAVLGLLRRLLASPRGSDVAATSRLSAMRRQLIALRHLGQAEEAIATSVRLREATVELGEVASHEDRALADLEHAASLFDPGWFEAALEILEPWCDLVVRDPAALAATSRIALWNTVARIRIALCTDGWQDLLERSLRLQMVVEPASCARTANYRIEGLLRTDMLDAAENAIAANARAITRHDAFSRAMLNVYRADLARRRGVCWSDDFVDGAPLPEREPTFPIGLYELAVARQSARPRSERARRLERAVLAFRSRGGDAASGPLEILSATTRLGIAEARGSVRLVEQAREGLRAIGSRGPIAERLARGAAAGLDFGALCDSLPWC